MSAKKADFQCALAIWWLRSVIVKIFDVPCIGEDVSLAPRKLKPFDLFRKHRREKLQ